MRRESSSSLQLSKGRRKQENQSTSITYGSLSSENAELARCLNKNKGRLVLRGADNVKDESGYNALCTEQDTSASQMTAAKFMDTISKFPGMTVQASDTESAFTQVKSVDAPRLLMLPEAECSEILIMIPPGQRTKSCDNIDNPVVPLEIPYDCSEKSKSCSCLSTCTVSRWSGNKHNLRQMWNVGRGKSTSKFQHE